MAQRPNPAHTFLCIAIKKSMVYTFLNGQKKKRKQRIICDRDHKWHVKPEIFII